MPGFPGAKGERVRLVEGCDCPGSPGNKSYSITCTCDGVQSMTKYFIKIIILILLNNEI